MASGHLTAPQQQAGQMAVPTSPASPSKNSLPTGSRPQMGLSIATDTNLKSDIICEGKPTRIN
jgi:hypothetical protein